MTKYYFSQTESSFRARFFSRSIDFFSFLVFIMGFLQFRSLTSLKHERENFEDIWSILYLLHALLFSQFIFHLLSCFLSDFFFIIYFCHFAISCMMKNHYFPLPLLNSRFFSLFSSSCTIFPLCRDVGREKKLVKLRKFYVALSRIFCHHLLCLAGVVFIKTASTGWIVRLRKTKLTLIRKIFLQMFS